MNELAGATSSTWTRESGGEGDDLYLAGAWMDHAVLGGLAIVAWLAAALLFTVTSDDRQPETTAVVGQLLFFLTLVFNWPHFAAAALPLYASRKACVRHAGSSIVAPLLVAMGMLLAIRYSNILLPVFCKLAVWWLAMHISMQTWALSQLYARRAGFDLNRLERLLLGLAVAATFLYPALRAELNNPHSNLLGIGYTSLAMPNVMRALLPMILIGGVASLGIFLWRMQVRFGRVPPFPVLLPVLAQGLWWLPVAWKGAENFFEPVAFFGVFHGLQYLFIDWQMRRRAHRAESDRPGAGVGERRWFHALRYIVIVFGAACIFFVGLPRVLSLLGPPAHLTTPAVWAALFFHHALIDGVFFKPRTPDAERWYAFLWYGDAPAGDDAPAPASAETEARA